MKPRDFIKRKGSFQKCLNKQASRKMILKDPSGHLSFLKCEI